MKIRISSIVGGSLHGEKADFENVAEGYHAQSIVDENGIEYCLVVYDHCNLLHTLLMNIDKQAVGEQYLSLIKRMSTLLEVASIAVIHLDGLPEVKKQWFELYESLDAMFVELGLVKEDDIGSEASHKDNAGSS